MTKFKFILHLLTLLVSTFFSKVRTKFKNRSEAWHVVMVVSVLMVIVILLPYLCSGEKV